MHRFKSLRIETQIFLIVVSVLITSIVCIELKKYSSSFIHSIDLNSVIITSEDDGSHVYSIGGISLPKGNYTFSANYALSGSASIMLAPCGSIMKSTPLEETSGQIKSVQYAFTLDFPSDSGKLRIDVPEGGNFFLESVNIISDKHIYSDGLVFAIALLLLLIGIWFGVLYLLKGNEIFGLCLVGIVVITILPILLTENLSIGGDLRAHLMRIDGIYFGMLDHQFPVIINPEWNNSYGQMGILYPSLFLYFPALLRLLGMSLMGTVRLTICVIEVISILIFYYSSRVFFDNKWQILLSIVLLNFEKTRIYGIFEGGKLGGALLAEVFIPLALAGLISILYKDGQKWYYLAIGIAGVMCSHIISSVVLFIGLSILSLISINRFRDKGVLSRCLKSVVLCIGLIFGTYFALLRFYFIDWNKDALTWRVFTDTLWKASAPFFDPRWTSPLILLVLCIILIIVCIVRKKKIKQIDNGMLPMFITSLILFLMATVYFPWEHLRQFSMVQYFTDMLQSGNRFVGLVGEICAFIIPAWVAPLIIENDKKLISNRVIFGLMMIAIIGVCFVSYVSSTKIYAGSTIKIFDEVLAEIEYEYEDYLPAGTLTEYYKSDTGYISDEKIINSYDYARRGTYIHYSYTALESGEYVEFPKFYYPGYVAYDEKGDKIELTKGDRNRIRVYIPQTAIIKEVNIHYLVDTPLVVCYVLSILIWIGSISIIIWYNIRVFFEMPKE